MYHLEILNTREPDVESSGTAAIISAQLLNKPFIC